MGSMAVTTVLTNELHMNERRASLVLTGSASYATNGDTLDLSAVTNGGFTKVYSVQIKTVGVGGGANDKYHCTYVPATAYAAGTGKVKIRDLTAASCAEVSNTTDLSAVTWVAEVMGI